MTPITALPEICYNILFMEKHGQPLSDPWSLRQTGVYHQQKNDLTPSRWIFLNLTSRTRSELDFHLKSKHNPCSLSLHVRLLDILGSNWAEYVEYLGSALRDHVSKMARMYSLEMDTLTDPG